MINTNPLLLGRYRRKHHTDHMKRNHTHTHRHIHRKKVLLMGSKSNEILSFMIMWVELEDITLREIPLPQICSHSPSYVRLKS